MTQVQDVELGLAEPHTTDLSPLIQPVQVSMQSPPTLSQINTSIQLGALGKFTEGNPHVQIINKYVKQDLPQN